MTSRERRLEAPHRRLESSSRVVERVTVAAYKTASAILARIPPAIPRAVIGRAAQASYLLWPSKRRWSNRNFGHVLGLSPDHPRVRRLALRAYRTYGRYVTELMRMPSRPIEELTANFGSDSLDGLLDAWRTSGRPLIVTTGHIGNGEAIVAGMASRGLPVAVVADDSAFPELFELLKQQRRSWGVNLIPWRNLREIYGVLRRNEILGLIVDWGYRFDDVPVRLFGAWTTLPSGPATLAAKTNALLVPVAIRRLPDGRFTLRVQEAIDIASASPAEIQRATQRIADALGEAIAEVPEQWYSFKPCWPSDPDEARKLEARAAAMQADTGAGA